MSNQSFIVLRVCLLALVHLVFLRVLRAVWVELRAEAAVAVPAPAAPMPATAAAPAASSDAATTTAASAGARLVIVSPAALAEHTFGLAGETTIGRGAGCAVAIDDARVSKLHARVYPGFDGWLVEDLGSTNGTALDGRLITAATPIAVGGRISIGGIVLELA